MWIVLSLISAFSLATSDAVLKKALHKSNEYLAAWARLLFTMPLLLALWIIVPIPQLDSEFYRAFFIALPVEMITIVLYVKALKVSPMSLTLPFLALTPVFLILVSFLVLGEKISLSGGLGIVLIAVGSYQLNISFSGNGFWGPLRAVMREKGSVMMILVATLYSVTSSYGKVAIEHSSPLFFAIAYFSAIAVLFAPVGLWMGRAEIRTFRHEGRFGLLLLSGVFNAIMIISHMYAINLTKVAYMIAVKRTSLLIGVVYGYYMFREEDIRGRFLGAFLMFAGFAVIVLSG